MRTQALLCMVMIAAVLILAPTTASADGKGTSLGVEGGVTWQINDGNSELADISEAYGFFVDLPLTSTFYISPETVFYRYNIISGGDSDGDYGSGITDLSLNFKFIVPLGKSKLSFAMRGGATNGIRSESGFPMTVHFGFSAGYMYNFISNLAFTTKVMWTFMPSEQGNLYRLFGMIGLRFTI